MQQLVKKRLKWKNFCSSWWKYWFPEICANYGFKFVVFCCNWFCEKLTCISTELQLFMRVEN